MNFGRNGTSMTEHGVLFSSFSETTGHINAFHSAENARLYGDLVRAAQPGIEWVMMHRRQDGEWETINGETVKEVIQSHWSA